jgi:hypothetical protein
LSAVKDIPSERASGARKRRFGDMKVRFHRENGTYSPRYSAQSCSARSKKRVFRRGICQRPRYLDGAHAQNLAKKSARHSAGLSLAVRATTSRSRNFNRASPCVLLPESENFQIGAIVSLSGPGSSFPSATDRLNFLGS